MKRYILGIVFCSSIFTGLFSICQAGTPQDPYKYFFNETWGDFREELANAREQNKVGIMFFFEQDECPFCHYMKTNVLNQPEVQEYFRKHFLLFPMDIEGDVEIKNLAGKTMKQKDFSFKENKVRATPVFAFFDLDGKRVHRHIGKTNGIEEFMWVGEYVVKGEYRNIPFIKYKNQRRKN